jgi:RHS repeat-associated protein
VYGKIIEINKVDIGSAANNIDRVKKITYTYDASGNRISKKIEKYISGSAVDYTWYVRDASGNVMSTYNYSIVGTDLSTGSLLQDEVYLYGSNRLGSLKLNRNVELTKQIWDTTYTLGLGLGIALKSAFTRGIKQYELSNHLGNVLVTVSDKKLGHTIDGTTVDYYNADVITANDYYPFGMTMPGRKYSQPNTKYRYGFNGKEKDNEVKGDGNQIDYGGRIYDPRIGRWLSVDPKWQQYAEWSPYNFALDNPIRLTDADGQGVGEPMHHLFFVTVALDIYDAAKLRGASGRGALLVMAQASIESGYGNDAIKRGDYNLFGVMTNGSDFKAKTSHGRIKDYSNNGQYAGAINDYFDNKGSKWPLFFQQLIKKGDFTSDDVDAALYTGKSYETKTTRNKTGHLSYNADDISKDEKINNNKYGAKLIAQMDFFRARLIASIDYQTNSNNTRLGQIDKELKSIEATLPKADLNRPFIIPQPSKEIADKISALSAEQKKLQKQNDKLENIKKDVSN